MQGPDPLVPRDIQREVNRTRPDYIVYQPRSLDGREQNTGNEHFLVFDGPDGSLMAVWTQSSAEAQPDQHIAFARSTDEGKTWSPPQLIATNKGSRLSYIYIFEREPGELWITTMQGGLRAVLHEKDYVAEQ